MDGKPISSKGQTVLEAEKIAPTVLPFLFAAVVGRLLQTFARWKVEHGASLGVCPSVIELYAEV